MVTSLDEGTTLLFGKGSADSLDMRLEELACVVSTVASQKAFLASQVLVERTANKDTLKKIKSYKHVETQQYKNYIY